MGKKRQPKAEKPIEVLEMFKYSRHNGGDLPPQDAEHIRQLKCRAEIEEFLIDWAESLLPDEGPSRFIAFREHDGKIVAARLETHYELKVQELSEEEYESDSRSWW